MSSTPKPQDAVCVICLCPLSDENVKCLPCAHSFHEKCLNYWLLHKPSCPICRYSLAPARPLPFVMLEMRLMLPGPNGIPPGFPPMSQLMMLGELLGLVHANMEAGAINEEGGEGDEAEGDEDDEEEEDLSDESDDGSDEGCLRDDTEGHYHCHECDQLFTASMYGERAEVALQARDQHEQACSLRHTGRTCNCGFACEVCCRIFFVQQYRGRRSAERARNQHQLRCEQAE